MTRSDVTRSDVTSQGKLGGCNHSRTTFIALERQHIRLCDVTFKCRSSHNLQLPLPKNEIVCVRGEKATLQEFCSLNINTPFTLVTSAARRHVRPCRTGRSRSQWARRTAAPPSARCAPRLRSLTGPTPASSVRSLCAERMREGVRHARASPGTRNARLR